MCCPIYTCRAPNESADTVLDMFEELTLWYGKFTWHLGIVMSEQHEQPSQENIDGIWMHQIKSLQFPPSLCIAVV